MTKTYTPLRHSSKNNLHETTRKVEVDRIPGILTMEGIDTMVVAVVRDQLTLLTGPVRQWLRTAIEIIVERNMERVINIISI